MTRFLHKFMSRLCGALVFCFALQAHSKETYCNSGICTLPELEFENRMQKAYKNGIINGITRGVQLAGSVPDCPIYVIQENSGGGGSSYDKIPYWNIQKKEFGGEIGIEMYYQPKRVDSDPLKQYMYHPGRNVLEWKDTIDQTWKMVDMGNDHWQDKLDKADSSFPSVFEALNAGIFDAMVVGDRYAFVEESRGRQ